MTEPEEGEAPPLSASIVDFTRRLERNTGGPDDFPKAARALAERAILGAAYSAQALAALVDKGLAALLDQAASVGFDDADLSDLARALAEAAWLDAAGQDADAAAARAYAAALVQVVAQARDRRAADPTSGAVL